MEGFEYGNARLRAMRSRLLSRHEIELFASAASLPELIGLLTKTPYRKSLEVALVQRSDLDSVFEALRQDFVETARKIRGFYGGREAVLVGLVFSDYDLHNLKTVLRGLSRHAARADIETLLLPVGEMSETLLSELLRVATPREAVDVLATLGHPAAQPLLVVRVERPGSDLMEMEQALDHWHFQKVTQFTQQEPDEARLILASLRREADIRNLLTVLRFVHTPGEQKQVKARLEQEGFSSWFAGVGSVSVERLNQVYTTRNMKAALALLADTPYAAALREGLRAYERSTRLSDIEQTLRRDQLRWQASQIARDPLGAGVVIGYLALKANEIANLRRIARGIQMKLGAEANRAELEWAA